MNTMTFLDLVIIIATLGFAEYLRKKDRERFSRLMASTMIFVLNLGVVFSFIQLLAEWHLFESLMTKLLAAFNKLGPIDFMASVSFLFLCSPATEKWTVKTTRKESHI